MFKGEKRKEKLRYRVKDEQDDPAIFSCTPDDMEDR